VYQGASVNTGPFTERQFYAMCDVDLDLPRPLSTSLPPMFLYDRKWGVMFCPGGSHNAAMALLYAFHRGYQSRIEGMQKEPKIFMDYHVCADLWLETIPGTAFRSSVGGRVTRAWSPESLAPYEARLLGPIDYIGR
jgi:hypothetical protein